MYNTSLFLDKPEQTLINCESSAHIKYQIFRLTYIEKLMENKADAKLTQFNLTNLKLTPYHRTRENLGVFTVL